MPPHHPIKPSVRTDARTMLVVAAASVALVGIAFHAALSGSFVWDDLQIIYWNEAYRGFSANSLHWMFTTTYGGHYQPLTWLSYSVDDRLWGVDDAFGFHLTNLALHATTGVIVFHLSWQLLASAGHHDTVPAHWVGAFVAGTFFLIHPLRVESVAWATERRDLLSALFLTISVLFYVRRLTADDLATRRRYLAASVAVYVLSLLSKATGMTLPVVLLILDTYPFRRFTGSCQIPERRNVIFEKVWYVVPATLTAWLAATAQSQAGAMWTLSEHPLSLRIGQAFYGLAFYPFKTLWPTNLVPLYEQSPDATMINSANVIAAVVVLGLSVLLWTHRKRLPALLAAWAAYLVLVSPMLGLAQSGPQVVADRYSYVSCLPLTMLLGAGFQRIWISRRNIRPMLVISSLAIGVVLVEMTQAQTKVWRDPLTLWTTTLERAPDTPSAHAALGAIHYNRGDYERSREHSLAALKILPGNRSAHVALAKASLALADGTTAEHAFRTALDITAALKQTDLDSMMGLAESLAQQSQWDEAEALDRSLLANPPRALTAAEQVAIEAALHRHTNKQLAAD